MGFDKNKINKLLGASLVFLIIAFASLIVLQLSSILLGPSKSACTKKVCLAKFLEGPPAFNDPTLKRHLEDKFLVRSNGPPNYSLYVGFNPTVRELMKYILDYFHNKRDGRFVVLGAGDGEYQDVTLPLENDLGWTGLLVEPHPRLFELLNGKGRRATLSSNCVSPFAYPAVVTFGHRTVGVGDSDLEKFEKYRGTQVKQLFEDVTDLVDLKVQCVPLENLVYASDVTDIDLLVLDMNGGDLDVVANVKLDMIPNVKMLILRSSGTNVGSDVGSFFLDKNLILKKVLTDVDGKSAFFILTVFNSEDFA